MSHPSLAAHAAEMKKKHLNDLFRDDPARFQDFSIRLPGLLADFSKHLVTRDTIALLLADAARVKTLRDAMFRGDAINTTENRAVLHTALREDSPRAEVRDVLESMRRFTDDVRGGVWRGHSGREITDIVNIGIGGSSLGPELVTEALAHLHHPRLSCHFAANVEASDIYRKLEKLSPETTLFIVASKTFTTAETMQNTHIARQWLLDHYKGDMAAVARHFVAASTNADAVTAFGIAPQNMFPFRDWVGGRYSVWSSIGLSVMLMTGADNFAGLLAGARIADDHFRTAPPEKNIPFLMGVIGHWYRNHLDYPALAVIPYHAQLRRLPAFLQQLDMESNGKSVTRDGAPVAAKTGPIIFGEPGTDAQHSFFQWLHQSPDIVPVDFIAAVRPHYGSAAQHRMLLANCLAQAEALMTGKDGGHETHRHFAGNRPSTMILLDALTPETLGTLLAIYEHKVFVQGALWNINSFDQWGVELGKVMAKTIESDLSGATHAHDGSTTALIAHIKSL